MIYDLLIMTYCIVIYDIQFIDNNLLYSYFYLLFHFSFNCEKKRDVKLRFRGKCTYKS